MSSEPSSPTATKSSDTSTTDPSPATEPASQAPDTDADGNASLSAFTTATPQSAAEADSPEHAKARAPTWPLPDRPSVTQEDLETPTWVENIEAEIDTAFDSPNPTATEAPTDSSEFSIKTGQVDLLTAIAKAIASVGGPLQVTAVDSGLRVSTIDSANTIMARTYLPASAFRDYTSSQCRFEVDASEFHTILTNLDRTNSIHLRPEQTTRTATEAIEILTDEEAAALTALGYTTASQIAQASTTDLTEEVEIPNSNPDSASDTGTTEYTLSTSRATEISHHCQPALTATSTTTSPSAEVTPITADEETGNATPIRLHSIRSQPEVPNLSTETEAALESREFARIVEQANKMKANVQLSTDPNTVHGNVAGSTDVAHVTTAATTFGGISTTYISHDLLKTAHRFVTAPATPDSLIKLTHLGSADRDDPNTDSDCPSSLESFPCQLSHEHTAATANAFSTAFIAPRVRDTGDENTFAELAYNADAAPNEPPIYARQSLPTRQPIPFPEAFPDTDNNTEYIGTLDRSTLQEWISPLESHADEMQCVLSPDGIKAGNVDPANVAVGLASLDAASFEEYNLEETLEDQTSIGISHTALNDLVKTFPEDTLLSLYYNPQTHNLSMVGSGLRVTHACINPDSIRTVSIPATLNLTGNAFLSVNNLRTAVTAANKAGLDNLTLTLANENLHIYGDGPNDTQCAHSVRTFDSNGVAQSRFSTDYLDNWVTQLEQANVKTIWLYFGMESPMLCEYDLDNNGTSGKMLLAPRVSTDEDADIPDRDAIDSLPATPKPFKDPDVQWTTDINSDPKIPACNVVPAPDSK